MNKAKKEAAQRQSLGSEVACGGAHRTMDASPIAAGAEPAGDHALLLHPPSRRHWLHKALSARGAECALARSLISRFPHLKNGAPLAQRAPQPAHYSDI